MTPVTQGERSLASLGRTPVTQGERSLASLGMTSATRGERSLASLGMTLASIWMTVFSLRASRKASVGLEARLLDRPTPDVRPRRRGESRSEDAQGGPDR